MDDRTQNIVMGFTVAAVGIAVLVWNSYKEKKQAQEPPKEPPQDAPKPPAA